MLEHVQEYCATLPTSAHDWTLKLRSPGRINVIGEHVDYTGGLVMPASIDRGIDFAARYTDAPALTLHAVDLGETHTLPLPLNGKSGTLWVNYLAGIVTQYQDQGHLLPGLEIVFGGDVPRGSGMSSSAALEGGMAFLLNEVLSAGLSRPELAQLCQRSSNTYLGIPSGIMDQFASLNGRATGPIVLNCATLESDPVKDALEAYAFVLVNTMVSHDLSDGAYAARVAECQRALSVLQEDFPKLTHLSETHMAQLERVAERMGSVELQRAKYVIAENDRVRAAILALEAGSALELGRLINETHRGLSEEYEVSCAQLDFLQATVQELDGVAGARMMGGGFGGCTINLVKAEAVDSFAASITQAYESAYGITPEVYPVNLAPGTHLL